MLQEADIEELLNVVIVEVQFLQVLKCLDTLHFFQFASREMQDSHEFETGTDVAEASDQRIVHFQILKWGEDLSDHLQIMAWSVDSHLNLLQPWKLITGHIKVIRQEFLI